MILIDKLNITIWEREFELPVEYDCYSGEEVTKEQIEAISKISNDPKIIAEARPMLESYCKDAVMQDNQNQKKDNVFSYIKPEYWFVRRTKDGIRVSLLCKYRYEGEHGIAIVFAPDGKISIGPQDIA